MDDDERARLEAAGLVAPIVRGMDERTLRRRVHTYDRETGAPVRDVTVRELVGGLAKVTALEVEVIEGKRPKTVPCERCGKPIAVPSARLVPRFCPWTVGGCNRQLECDGGCGARPNRNSFSSDRLAKRGSAPWRCPKCCDRSNHAARMAAIPMAKKRAMMLHARACRKRAEEEKT